MKNFAKTYGVGCALLLASACANPGIPTIVKASTKPLPDSKITIEGTDYRLKRAIALNGRQKGKEVWAIVVAGQTYSCTTATRAGCEFTLDRAKKKQRAERDMGY
ncbi:hypothetical protein [uncultured Litoreibacter sp.]|uniref:hypothetical protein n=1 Tax=uncultured Litoreibacter sp. TaxID=1392394 RepID=UPI002604080B|nr:hypothetical protein [uncultured Litoreibacter sp.]